MTDVVSNSPTGSVTQTYFQTGGDFSQEAFSFQVSQGFYFPELSNMVQLPEHGVGTCPLLLCDLLTQEASKKEVEEKMNMQEQQHHFVATSAAASPTTATSSINEIHGMIK